ncbi:MAG: PilZ domain-containing protein [Parasphingopyxis sp.]|uniref:PilZ domain-containing protein n=1 Tax=Parasphingopyxis sp. TaxID=1920299 RepID=UPI003F9FBC29
MSISAELLVETPESDERRAAPRAPIDVRAGFRKSGYHASKADISDVSAKGCRVAGALQLAAGTEIWIRLPGLQPLRARVAWTDGFEAGCEFATPFHDAVLDNFLRGHQAA